MFAGPATRDLVLQNLNGVKNVMNIQGDAHTSYDNFKWGIEAKRNNGTVRTSSWMYPKPVIKIP
jgi:hypothetical protein